jgi:hypothetical protein
MRMSDDRLGETTTITISLALSAARARRSAWLASDFAEAIMFDEGDAVQHAAGEESECRAHDNLNAIPQAASVGDKAAA